MKLRTEQVQAFAGDGYLVVPGIVGPSRVDKALRAINHWLIREYDPAERGSYFSRTFAPELCGNPLLLDMLLGTGGFDLATELVGRPLVRPHRAQIALRFPAAPGAAPEDYGPHLDGIAAPANGVPADGRVHGFTLLAGILLSELRKPDRGNFTVWPGTHVSMAKWFAEHGTGVPDPEGFFATARQLAAMSSAPRAVIGDAGDLVLAHHLLLHGAGPHRGPGIRYAVFFRLSSVDRNELGDSVLTDPWVEWPAVRPVAAHLEG